MLLSRAIHSHICYLSKRCFIYLIGVFVLDRVSTRTFASLELPYLNTALRSVPFSYSTVSQPLGTILYLNLPSLPFIHTIPAQKKKKTPSPAPVHTPFLRPDSFSAKDDENLSRPAGERMHHHAAPQGNHITRHQDVLL